MFLAELFESKEQQTAFMQDLWDHTEEHPLDQSMRLYGVVGIKARPWDGKIHLGDIITYDEHRRGHATETLEMLKVLADKHGVVLSGTAKAYSKDPRHIGKTKQLLQWYQKHGFTLTPGYSGSEKDGYNIWYVPPV